MDNNLLIEKLLFEKAFNHSISHLKLIETHVSWVILTGEFAYKIKKPVDFEFLDFSTLEKRKYFCEEELRLGQQFASEIYLKVVPIRGSPQDPRVEGSKGPILEYAIKMREFPQQCLFSTLLKQQGLNEEIIDQLGELVANFHKETAVAVNNSDFGLPEQVHAPVKQNFEQMAALLSKPSTVNQLARLESWADQQFEKHHFFLQQRKRQGFIRDCHGDLHLANIILYKNHPLLFDRLEFNQDLRWTDVISDLAFLVMDFMANRKDNFANQLINTYLYHTQDYQGLRLLPYYLAYRAVIRAKIALFRSLQPDLTKENQKKIKKDYANYIKLAEFFIQPKENYLIIMHGYSGSGKTTLAKKLAYHCGAIHLSSDVVRKSLFGIPLQSSSNSDLNQGIYTPEANRKTYTKLRHLAEIVLQSNYTAIVDASFLRRNERKNFEELAQRYKIPFYIIDCQTSHINIKKRILLRKQTAAISEADEIVFNEQKKYAEKLSEEEQRHSLIVKDENKPILTLFKAICPDILESHR